MNTYALVDAYEVKQFRYFFLREVPFGQDGNYSHEAIVTRINADLSNDLGNLAQRSLTMIARQLGGVLPQPGDFSAGDRAILAWADLLDRQGARSDNEATVSAPGSQRGLGGRGGSQPLFRRRGAVGARQDGSPCGRERFSTVRPAEVLRQVAILIQPFMPQSAAKLLDLLGAADLRSNNSPRWGANAASPLACSSPPRRRSSRAMWKPDEKAAQ